MKLNSGLAVRLEEERASRQRKNDQGDGDDERLAKTGICGRDASYESGVEQGNELQNLVCTTDNVG